MATLIKGIFFHFSELNTWWHNHLHTNNRIYKKVIFRKPVLFHDCVQITDYKVHVYMLHVVCNTLHTNSKVRLYKLHVTRNMLRITRYTFTDYKRHKIFSSVSRFHRVVAVLHWSENRNAPPPQKKIILRMGALPLQLHFWYVLNVGLQVASWSLQLNVLRVTSYLFLCWTLQISRLTL